MTHDPRPLIRGKGADETIVDAARLDRVFHVQGCGTVTLSRLTVTGGKPLESEKVSVRWSTGESVESVATAGASVDSRHVTPTSGHLLRNARERRRRIPIPKR
jgi:hypothetical protein